MGKYYSDYLEIMLGKCNNDASHLPKIYINTSQNDYIYESIDYLTLNGKLYSPQEFGFTDSIDSGTSSSSSDLPPKN